MLNTLVPRLKIILLLLFSQCLAVQIPTEGHAEARNIGEIRVTDEISSWNEALRGRVQALKKSGAYPASGYTECAEAAELSGAILCLSYDRNDMNSAFSRISAYVEGLKGIRQGEVVTHAD